MKFLVTLLIFLAATNTWAVKYEKVMDGETLLYIKDTETGTSFTDKDYTRYNNYLRWEIISGTTATVKPKPVDPKDDPVNKAVLAEMANLDFGKRLFAEIKVMNKSKGLTKGQRQQLKTSLASVLEDLLDGNICDVKTALPGIAVDGTLVKQSDIDSINAKIDAYKTCP